MLNYDLYLHPQLDVNLTLFLVQLNVLFLMRQETITLVVEDRDIEAPSSLLVAASDVFRSMITSDFLERKTGRIELPEKSYDAVKFMIDYITSQDYVPIEGNVSNLRNYINHIHLCPQSAQLGCSNFNVNDSCKKFHNVAMKLLFHSQTSTVQPLNFGNGQVISSHTLQCM